ncbi:MAG TPA: FAD binding domain-containing protein [Chloroflexota bacterium]|jgi:carbon-monoxide dehydrogenase medium subunit
MPALLPRFSIEQPSTLAEASDMLRGFGEDARAYAGGTELLLAMKYAGLRYEHLVDLKTIPGLDGIVEASEGLRIGALASHRAVERSPLVRERFPALAELEAHVANPRVRASGTLGGNLCFAEPHSDPATLLLCLDAQLATSQRQLALADFLVGPYEVALEEGELLEAILIPWLLAGWRAHYRKVQFHERPMLGLALVTGDGQARVAIGSASPTPRRCAAAEALLAEGRLDDAAEALADEAELIDDLEGSAEYKRHLIHVELGRAYEALLSC